MFGNLISISNLRSMRWTGLWWGINCELLDTRRWCDERHAEPLFQLFTKYLLGKFFTQDQADEFRFQKRNFRANIKESPGRRRNFDQTPLIIISEKGLKCHLKVASNRDFNYSSEKSQPNCQKMVIKPKCRMIAADSLFIGLAAVCLFSLAANCIVNCSNMLIIFSHFHFYNFKRFIIFLRFFVSFRAFRRSMG